MAEELVAAEAKTLSEEEAKARVDRAFALEVQIKESFHRVHGAWWDLSRYLYDFQEGGCWALLGYDTLEEFLAQPDLGMSRSHYFLMVKLWRDLVITREIKPEVLAEIEPTKVREVTPAIMRGEVEVDKALDDARDLGYRDLREEYGKPSRKKKDPESDRLDASEEPERVQCPQCQSWVTKEMLADG